MTIARRLTTGLLANGMGQVWSVLIQLVTVPVLAIKWGATGYGTWLMISTVPTYVLLSSAGFGGASAVDMTRNYALGDRDKALAAFQSVWLLISGILAGVTTLAGLLWVFRAPLLALVPAVHASDDVLTAMLLMVVYSAAILEMILVMSGYQCSRRYAEGTFLFDLTYPAEAAALICAALLGGGMILAALSITLVRLAALTAFYLRLRHHEPWFRFGWSHATLATVRRLAHPAVAGLSLSLSGAFNLDGLLLTLGICVSPAATAVFGTTRTVTRIPLQLVAMGTRATGPEITAALTTGNRSLSVKLMALNMALTLGVVIPAVIVLALVGPTVVDVLSHHRLKPSWLLCASLALTGGLYTTWTTIGGFLYAINKQQKYAYHYLVLCAVVGLSPFFVGASHTSAKAAMVWCSAEFLMLVVVYRAWLAETHVNFAELVDSWKEFFALGRSTLRQIAGRAGLE